MDLTRQAARKRWEEFLPKVTAYGRVRNHVVAGHSNVSLLSGALRFRTILEDEVVAETLGAHSFEAAEKWLQEVCWRRYWKGWLEQRPQVWSQWRNRVRTLEAELQGRILERARRVMAGESGVDCMDRIARELLESGYLHNHARMWWASFWIHGEQLPWELGADFFFRHLLDADPASNTLSWRWVAGVQTPGKTYIVRLSNLEKYGSDYLKLGDRGAERLADENVRACVVEDRLDTRPRPLPEYPEEFREEPGRTGLWLHPDDLTPEIGALRGAKPAALSACVCEKVCREHFGLSPGRMQSVRTVLRDGVDRASAHYGCMGEVIEAVDPVAEMVGWAQRNRLDAVVGFAPMVGPTGDLVSRLDRELGAVGVALRLVRRASDAEAFSMASAGFFPFWQRMRQRLMERQ